MIKVNGIGLADVGRSSLYWPPNLKVSSSCPKCGRTYEFVPSPVVLLRSPNKATPIPFFCDSCEEGWEERVEVRVTVRPWSDSPVTMVPQPMTARGGRPMLPARILGVGRRRVESNEPLEDRLCELLEEAILEVRKSAESLPGGILPGTFGVTVTKNLES